MFLDGSVLVGHRPKQITVEIAAAGTFDAVHSHGELGTLLELGRKTDKSLLAQNHRRSPLAAFVLLQSEDGSLTGVVVVIVTADTTARRIHGIEAELAIQITSPAPVHREIVVRGVSVEHKGMAGLVIEAGIEDRAVGIQLILHQLVPVGRTVLMALQETARLVIIHVLDHRNGHIGSRCTSSLTAKIGLKHKGHIGHEVCHFVGLAVGVGTLLVLQEHIVPIVCGTCRTAGNGSLVGLVLIARDFHGAGLRPLQMAHDNGQGCGCTAGWRLLATHRRSELIIRCILTPLGRVELLYHTAHIFRTAARHRRSTLLAQVVHLFLHVLEPRLEVFRKLSFGEVAIV